MRIHDLLEAGVRSPKIMLDKIPTHPKEAFELVYNNKRAISFVFPDMPNGMTERSILKYDAETGNIWTHPRAWNEPAKRYVVAKEINIKDFEFAGQVKGKYKFVSDMKYFDEDVNDDDWDLYPNPHYKGKRPVYTSSSQ